MANKLGAIVQFDKQAFPCYTIIVVKEGDVLFRRNINKAFLSSLAVSGRKETNKEVSMTKHVDYNDLMAHEAVAIVTVAVLAVANVVMFALQLGLVA